MASAAQRIASPSTAASEALRADEATVHRRAVEAALWGMPLVNFDALRRAYLRDAGAKYNDVVYWSKPADWRTQFPTPNASTKYALVFVNLKGGPVVVEIPAADDIAVRGSLIDAWNVPMIDVGDDGADRGWGGRYLLLPPDSPDDEANDHIAVRSATYNNYVLLRLITAGNADDDPRRVTSWVGSVRVYPRTRAIRPPPTRCLDLSGMVFDAIPCYDPGFYASLARVVAEEPVQGRDLAMLGQCWCLGIGAGARFEPDAVTRMVLHRAITDAHAAMRDRWALQGTPWWPHRHWRSLIDAAAVETDMRFIVPGRRLMLDERAATFFGRSAVAANPRSTGAVHLKTHTDQDGEPLDGAMPYHLRVPGDVPASRFWSVAVYDADSAGFIRGAPVVGRDSYDQRLDRHADGSVDLFFAPEPPPHQETNWIYTAPDRAWFVLFRVYGPGTSLADRSWELPDIERIWQPPH